MDLQLITALPNTPVEWGWPVQTGILRGPGFSAAVLQRHHWAQDLSILHSVAPPQKPTRRLHLLLLNGIPEAQRIAAIPTVNAPSADVVLVKLTREFFIGKEPNTLLPLVHGLARACKAGGVFFFASGLKDPVWYNELIVELSHNLGIGAALGKIPNTGGWGFVSPGLEKATQLSTFIAKLSAAMLMNKIALRQPVGYYHHQKGFVNTGNHKELATYFLNNMKQLDFSGESKTASVIKEVTGKLKTQPTTAAKPVYKPMIPVKKGVSGKPIMIKNFPKKGFDFEAKDLGSFFPDHTSDNYKPITIVSDPGFELPKKHITHAKPPVKKNGGGGHSPVTATPKKKAAKPPVKKAAAKPGKKVTDTPRYLQAEFYEQGKKKKIKDFLLPQTTYELQVGIGEENKDRIQATISVGGLQEVFADATVKEAPIDLLLYSNTQKKPQQGKIMLPRQGDSDLASFSISTGSKQKFFEGTVYAFHKDRLLQKAVLRSDIRNKGDKATRKKIDFTTEAVLRQDLATLDDRPAFGMSVIIPEEEKKKQPLPAMAGGQSLDLQVDDGIRGVISSIQQYIDEVVTVAKKGKSKLDDEEHVKLLVKLANAGNMLYLQLLQRSEIQGPLQIVSKNRNYTPLEFVYSFSPPNEGAALCPNAAKALKKGACMNCFPNKKEMQAHVCPLGFWGLNRVIERHQYQPNLAAGTTGYTVKNEPVTGRKPLKLLNRTLHAESAKVDVSSAGMIQKIEEAITAASAVKPKKASDWNKWVEAVEKTDPDSLVLVVHLEDKRDTAGTDALEIGDQQFLLINHFDEDYINKRSATHTPFLVLIGCQTSDMQLQGFDAGSLAASYGAAIVLSNFTRIQGKHAGEIVIRLMKLLKANTGKDISFGEIMLQLKQQLLADGILVVLTLLAYGDADWKIKT